MTRLESAAGIGPTVILGRPPEPADPGRATKPPPGPPTENTSPPPPGPATLTSPRAAPRAPNGPHSPARPPRTPPRAARGALGGPDRPDGPDELLAPGLAGEEHAASRQPAATAHAPARTPQPPRTGQPRPPGRARSAPERIGRLDTARAQGRVQAGQQPDDRAHQRGGDDNARVEHRRPVLVDRDHDGGDQARAGADQAAEQPQR